MSSQSQGQWINEFLWSCGRHIPTSLLNLADAPFCYQCRAPRPPPRAPVVAPPPVDPPSNVIPLRPKCARPTCRRKARPRSPYCGKSCGDRCRRLLQRPDPGGMGRRVQATLESWKNRGKDKG